MEKHFDKELAQIIDHTLLKAGSTKEEVILSRLIVKPRYNFSDLNIQQ